MKDMFLCRLFSDVRLALRNWLVAKDLDFDWILYICDLWDKYVYVRICICVHVCVCVRRYIGADRPQTENRFGFFIFRSFVWKKKHIIKSRFGNGMSCWNKERIGWRKEGSNEGKKRRKTKGWKKKRWKGR